MPDIPESIELDLNHLESLSGDSAEGDRYSYPRAQISRVKTWWMSFDQEYRAEVSRPPPTPRIGQAEGNSIDIHWDGVFSLLVNVPAAENEPCEYYGFSTAKPSLEFQGQSPLGSLGPAIQGYIRDFVK